MYTVGGIEYKIDADTSELLDSRRDVDKFGRTMRREFKGVDKESKKLNVSITKLASSIRLALVGGAIGGLVAAATAATAALGAAGIAAAKANREMEILARIAGMNVQNFKAMAFAAQQFGLNTEQLGSTMQDVFDRLGDYTTAGTGAFQDFVDVIGATKEEGKAMAREFNRLSGREVLLKMVESMEKSNASSSEMIFALQSIGGETSRLLPLLRNEGELLLQIEERYKRVTAAMRTTEKEKVALAELSAAFDLLGASTSAASAKISAQLAPAMTAFLNDLSERMPSITNDIVNFLAMVSGDEKPRTLINVQDEVEKLDHRIESLQTDIKKAQSDGSYAEWMAQIFGKDSTQEAVDSMIKSMSELIQKRNELQKELNQKINEAEGEDPIKVESSLAGLGLPPEEKEALDRRLKDLAKYYEDRRQIIERDLNLEYQYENEIMGGQIINEKRRYDDQLRALRDKNTREMEELEKHKQDVHQLRQEQADELEFFEGEGATQEQLDRLRQTHEQQLAEVVDYNTKLLEAKQGFNDAELALEHEHQWQLEELLRKQAEMRKIETMRGMSMVTSAVGGAFGNIADILEKSEGEQSSAYKAMFALQKGFAVATAGLNFSVALSQALSLPADVSLPQKLASYATVATAFGSILSAVAGASYGGGRQYGGPVGAGSFYEVNETGAPEILTTGGKDYLTMGDSSGKVTPLDKAGMGMEVVINNYGPADMVETRVVDKKFVIDVARREARRAAQGAVGEIESQFENNKGRVYSKLVQNTNVRGQAGSGR